LVMQRRSKLGGGLVTEDGKGYRQGLNVKVRGHMPICALSIKTSTAERDYRAHDL